MFEDIKGGLWAELIVNRGFEDVAPPPAAAHYWERYPDTSQPRQRIPAGRRGHRSLRAKGYPTSFENRAQVLVNSLPETDGSWHLPVGHSRTLRPDLPRVRLATRRRCRADTGEGLSVSGAFEGSVRVSLEQDRSGGEIYAAHEMSDIPGEWTRFEFELPVSESDPLARFVFRIYGVGAVWIDQVSLVPSDAVNSIRSDVLAKVRALQPAFVRWPGGNVAQDYHWEWGIGPRDERPIWVNMSWDNDPEPADFGTIEYLEFCKSIGAEPNIVVKTPRGAA